MIVELNPLEGIRWNGKSIPLGSSRQDVEQALGTPEAVRGCYYYFNSELRFDFDSGGRVEFIEFLGGCEGSLRPHIYGVDAFAADAEELCRLLERHSPGPVIDAENGHSRVFGGISVGLYREITPQDVQELRDEIRANGGDAENNGDLLRDEQRARRWAAIGLGRKGYYQ